MKNPSIKILFLGMCFFIISLNASAQCVDDAKKLEKFKKTYRDKGIQDGIKFLTDEIAKNPNCFWFYIKRGELHNYSRDYDLSFANYRKAFELVSLTTSPVWEAEKNFYTGDDGKIEINLAEIGGKANKEQKNQLCIDAYSFALELRKKRDKKYSDYLFGRGDCSYNNGQFEAASGDYLQGIELISGENPSGAIRVVNAILGLPKATHLEKFRLLGCRLKLKNNDSEGAVTDCTEALKIDPNLSEAKQLLADAKRNDANKKAEEQRQAQIAEEKRQQKRAEDERREREYIQNLKQNNPKRYGLLQKAIEQNDTESIKLLVAGLREIYFNNPAENFDGNFNGAVLYLRVYSPKLDVGLLENKLSMRISRPADLVLVPANRNNSDGKEAISKDKQSFDVPMSATYSIFFSGKKISSLLTDSATFRNGWSKMVNGINLACNCRAQPSDFQKGFDLSDELTDLESVEVESISWQGRITIRIVTRHGSNWSFSGVTTSYQNGSLNDTNSSNSSAQSSKVTTSKVETGNFGRAVITNKGSVYAQLNEIEGCLDWSWATAEQKRASGKSGWGSFTPQNGMEGEIIAKTENCVYHDKIVILKIGNYYVPIQEGAVRRF